MAARAGGHGQLDSDGAGHEGRQRRDDAEHRGDWQDSQPGLERRIAELELQPLCL